MRPSPIPRRAASLCGVCTATAFMLALLACAHGRTPVGPAEAPAARSSATPAATGPNFLIIITDDQRYDTVHGYMPITESRIAQQGVEFTRAYVTTPLCCPSRSSILTGMYARNHGVQSNGDPLVHPTIANRLHDAGYYTALVGKYLNSWDGSRRPEFSFWVSWPGSSQTPYFNPTLDVQGRTTRGVGYITHIVREYALEAINRAVASGRPFLIIVSHRAPHAPATPAPGDEGRFTGLPEYNPPSLQLSPEEKEQMESVRQKSLASMWSVDQANGALLDRLEELGELDNTFVLFLSDNGNMWGEHGLNKKNVLYEEAVRVPFLVRYPPLIPAPRVDDRLVANIDIAPTLYDLAGVAVPAGVDGQSLVPLLSGGGAVHPDVFLEAWYYPGSGEGMGVHTGRYVYLEETEVAPALYDLEVDPYQLENRAENPDYAGIVEQLRERLRSLGLPPPPPPPPPAQCGNTTDDDADGKTDYPADPGCTSSSDDSESPDPPTGSIALTATGKVKDVRRRTELLWTGASGSSVEVWRNGARISTVSNDGEHTDRLPSPATGTYTYKLCETGGAVCSNDAAVTF